MKRAAMTLVELLVALSLSAMLMVVLLAMLGQHSRTNRRLMEDHPFEPWKTRLKSQVESDYAGCRHVQVQPRRIVIDGYSTGEDLSRSGPSKIVYEIVSSKLGNRLYRERVDLLSSQPGGAQRELVCEGVDRFSLQTQLSTDVAPGILGISVHFDPVLKADSNTDGITKSEPKLNLVLVRHGGLQ